MSQPYPPFPPQQPPSTPPASMVTRRYPHDAAYIADAQSMAAAGWRVLTSQREPTGAIVTTYAPLGAPSQFTPQVMPQMTPQMTPQPMAPNPMHVSPQTQRRGYIVVGVFIGIVLLISIIGSIIGSALSGPGRGGSTTGGTSIGGAPTPNSAEATSAAFSASLDATATANAASATATPIPELVTGARLGGPMSAFDDAFGPEQGAGVWYPTLSGQSTMLSVQADATTGGSNPIVTTDGIARVWTLIIDYIGPNPPSTTQNAAICARFLPPDAHHVADNPNAPFPIEHVYRSQLLAASFQANSFQNNAGADVPPGTFDVIYDTRACAINIGQV